MMLIQLKWVIVFIANFEEADNCSDEIFWSYSNDDFILSFLTLSNCLKKP